MKSDIKSDSDGLTIEISEIQGSNAQLLAAFKKCQEGRCSCPTNEYEKLESLTIEQTEDKINLRLKVKKSQDFDSAEIEKCLKRTVSKIYSPE